MKFSSLQYNHHRLPALSFRRILCNFFPAVVHQGVNTPAYASKQPSCQLGQGWIFFLLFFLVITEAGSRRKSESPKRQMLAVDGAGTGGWKHFQCSSSISRSCCTFFPSSAARRAGCLAPLTLPASRGGGGGGVKGVGGRWGGQQVCVISWDKQRLTRPRGPMPDGEKQSSAAAGSAASV